MSAAGGVRRRGPAATWRCGDASVTHMCLISTDAQATNQYYVPILYRDIPLLASGTGPWRVRCAVSWGSSSRGWERS
jgi:hypothetical protein